MSMNVERWDLIHVIKKHEPHAPQVDKHGRHMPSAYVVTAVCGRFAKINDYGRNKLTDKAPTCIVCMAGGYDEQEK